MDRYRGGRFPAHGARQRRLPSQPGITFWILQNVPYITANIYGKSRNLLDIGIRNYSIDLW